MKLSSARSLVLVCLLVAGRVVTGAESPENPLTPAEALKKLMDGNRRYVSGETISPRRDAARRAAIALKQAPFATILCCADSRVPPEIIFDKGKGDLFVVRVAGNVEDKLILGSLEYAAAVLKSPLILVLGHQRCGAIAAAAKGGDLPGHLGAFVEAIEPAVEAAQEKHLTDPEEIARINVRLVAERLAKQSKMLAVRIASHDLEIVGGYYDLDTGRVELLEK